MTDPRLIVIAGPTGSGKSALALALAQRLGGEIVNYDSVQIHRGFDIGSAKPTREERSTVPHHLYDAADPLDEINAADYARLGRAVCHDVRARGKRAILVGGTFFWLRALLAGLPELPGRDENLRRRMRAIAQRPRGAARLHRWLSRVDPVSGACIAAADRHRVERALEVWLLSRRPISSWSREAGEELPSIKIGLRLERAELNARLDRRVDAMYAQGLIDETRGLLATYPESARPFGSIGYREAVAVIRGELSEPEAIAETRRRTRAYAKRQMTWLRSERNVQWLDASHPGQTLAAAMRLIEVQS